MGGFGVHSMYQAPNLYATPDQTHDELLFHLGDDIFKKGVTLAAGYPNIRVGDILGLITATGKYRRLTNASADGSKAIGASTVKLKYQNGGPYPSSPFKVGDHIYVGGNADVTVVAVDNATATLTVTPPFTVAVADMDGIGMKTLDGSQVPVCIAARNVGPALYDPSRPNLNNMLDVDYEVDGIFQGIVKASMVMGLNSIMIMGKGYNPVNSPGHMMWVTDLRPALDALIIR